MVKPSTLAALILGGVAYLAARRDLLIADPECPAFDFEAGSSLERLCRYITRLPIATQRLTDDRQGRVVYCYKQPYRDGSTHVTPGITAIRTYCEFRSWPD